MRRENIELRKKDNIDPELIGESNPFRNFISKLDKVSRTNSRVLISGASGSGKEAASRFIHYNSRQSEGEFVAIDCSTSDQGELERLLFGCETRDGLQNMEL